MKQLGSFWLYSSNITQSFLCITLICTTIIDPKFVDAGREQVSELFPVLYQGLKRRKCFHRLYEQLGLDFAKYPKICNIFTPMTAMLICMLVQDVINLFVACGNCDLICYLVYI